MPEANDRLIDRRRILGQALKISLAAATVPLVQACATLPFTQNNGLPYSPAFFLATRSGSADLYLFGTLHLGLQSFYPLPFAVGRAFDQASRLAVEIDAKKHWSELVAGFRPYVRLPVGTTLANLFPADLLNEIRSYFDFADEQWQEMQLMQPWWVANFRFGTERDQRVRARAEYGVEQYLLAAARQRGKTIIELEKPIEQVMGLAGGTLQEQSTQLRSWFQVIKRRGGLMNDLISAWRRGDLALLAELKAETWGDEQQQTSLRRRFFTDRDARMAEQLAKLGAADEAAFIAVGAYHLVGRDSIPEALQQRGYSIELINTETRYERDQYVLPGHLAPLHRKLPARSQAGGHLTT